MNQESDIYATCFNEWPPIVWANPPTAGFGNATRSYSSRQANWHTDIASAGEWWRSGHPPSDLIEAQQTIPCQPMAFQGRADITIKLIQVSRMPPTSWTSPTREASLPDPYSTYRGNAQRVIADEGLSLFLVTRSDTPGATNSAISAGPAPQEKEQTSTDYLSEVWGEEDDLRFDFLVEKEALDELASNELDELERLSKKRDRTLARVSDEDWARERERSKALAELQDLFERYAPLFAKRR